MYLSNVWESVELIEVYGSGYTFDFHCLISFHCRSRSRPRAYMVYNTI